MKTHLNRQLIHVWLNHGIKKFLHAYIVKIRTFVKTHLNLLIHAAIDRQLITAFMFAVKIQNQKQAFTATQGLVLGLKGSFGHEGSTATEF